MHSLGPWRQKKLSAGARFSSVHSDSFHKYFSHVNQYKGIKGEASVGNSRAPDDVATVMDFQGWVPGGPLAFSVVVADPPSVPRPIPEASGADRQSKVPQERSWGSDVMTVQRKNVAARTVLWRGL